MDFIWSVCTKLLDICLVWLAFYYILKNVKNNIKMALILKGVIILGLVKFLSEIFNLYTVGVLLEYLVQWGPIAIIIIFQPEIRSVLESVGRTQLLGRHKVLTMDEREKIVFEIMKSVETFSKTRIGALIVIEREISLQNYIENSTKIYADMTNDLIETIFFPNSPLHDGGVIIQGDRVTSAGAVFKTSMSQNISKRLGTRHRAALGIAEESDAIALVISEENGRASIAVDGQLHYNLSMDEFRMLLIESLSPKAEVFFDADEGEEVNTNA
ncbi:MAG: diadenylate cyclase CdaA [bacterium]